MGGNKLAVGSGDGGAGEEENLQGLGDDAGELRVGAAGEEAELIRNGGGEPAHKGCQVSKGAIH